MNNFKEINSLFWPIAWSLILTSTLTFVDRAMISQYDVLAISAITIATQIQFLFGPVYFGILSGINTFTVQYHTRDEFEKLKQFLGIGLTLIIPLAILNFIVIVLFGEQIINFFVDIDSDLGKMSYEYMNIIKYSMVLMPFNMIFIYQYRAIKRAKIPLVMGLLQSMVNIFLNYCLIFGNFMFPELGIQGAAIATVITQFMFVVINTLYAIYIKAPFIGTPKEYFSYDKELFNTVFNKLIPLIIVELGFGIGRILYTKIYSATDPASFTAYNISMTISFMTNAFVISTANVSGIISGTYIAKRDKIKQKSMMKSMFLFMSLCSIALIVLSIFILPLFVPFFNVSEEMTILIEKLLIINGIYFAIRVFASSFFVILKSGGDNKFVMIADPGTTFVIGIPLTLFTLYFVSDSIVVLRSIMIIEMIAKVILGTWRYKKGIWNKEM